MVSVLCAHCVRSNTVWNRRGSPFYVRGDCGWPAGLGGEPHLLLVAELDHVECARDRGCRLGMVVDDVLVAVE